MLVCFSPPPKPVLLVKLIEGITAKHQSGEVNNEQIKSLENLITALTTKPANVDFLVLCIGIFNPEDAIFSKSYIYKK